MSGEYRDSYGEPDIAADPFEALIALYECGALKKGHFKLSSGLHSDTYVQCSQLLKDPDLAMAAGRALADAVGQSVDVVLSPALGAVVIGFTTAAALGCESIFAERSDGAMVLRRGFTIKPGAKVLLVEDVITTGGSILELAGIVDEAGAEVVALGCIVQRGEPGGWKGRIVPLARVTAEVYEPDECPLCRKGIEIDVPGSRHAR
jgi:orotate phosphoribosyltransferase